MILFYYLRGKRHFEGVPPPLQTPPRPLSVPSKSSLAEFHRSCLEFYATLWENAPSALFLKSSCGAEARWESESVSNPQRKPGGYFGHLYSKSPPVKYQPKISPACLFFFLLLLCFFLSHSLLTNHCRLLLMAGCVWGRSFPRWGGIHCKALQSRLGKKKVPFMVPF